MKLAFFHAHYTAPPGWYELSPWDHRHRRRTVAPQIIRGDPEILHALYGHLKKQKSTPWLYQSGVLVFNEPYGQIQRWQDAIIDSFEHFTFGGGNPSRFGRFWCLHLDETKVEFHWCFLRTDLISHRLVSWYDHLRDFPLFDAWEDFINISYSLASPKDPRRLQWIFISRRTPPPKRPQDLAEVQRIINDLSVAELMSRDHLCNLLELRECKIQKARDHCLVVQYGDSIFILAGPCCHAAFASPRYGEALLQRKQEKWTQYHNNPTYINEKLERLFQKRKKWLGNLLTHRAAHYKLPLKIRCPITTTTSNPITHHAAQTHTTPVATPPKPKANPQSPPPATPGVWPGKHTTAQCTSGTPPGATKSAPPHPNGVFGKVGGPQPPNHSSGTPGGSPNAHPPTPVMSLPPAKLPRIQLASPVSDKKSPGPDQPPLNHPYEVLWNKKKQPRKTPSGNPSPPDSTPPPSQDTPPPPPTPPGLDMDIS